MGRRHGAAGARAAAAAPEPGANSNTHMNDGNNGPDNNDSDDDSYSNYGPNSLILYMIVIIVRKTETCNHLSAKPRRAAKEWQCVRSKNPPSY